jgi:hypothetical protein
LRKRGNCVVEYRKRGRPRWRPLQAKSPCGYVSLVCMWRVVRDCHVQIVATAMRNFVYRADFRQRRHLRNTTTFTTAKNTCALLLSIPDSRDPNFISHSISEANSEPKSQPCFSTKIQLLLAFQTPYTQAILTSQAHPPHSWQLQHNTRQTCRRSHQRVPFNSPASS